MQRTSPTHDLDSVSNECGLNDIAELAAWSGIPVNTLRAFAAGEVALSAPQRLRILHTLLAANASSTPSFDTITYWLKLRNEDVLEPGRFETAMRSALAAYDALCEEARRELEEEGGADVAT